MPAEGKAIGQECKRGHDNWTYDVVGRKRCLTCKNIRESRSVKVDTPQNGGPVGQKCRRGHDDWIVNQKGTKRCKVCKYASKGWSSRRVDENGVRHYDIGAASTLLWDTLTYDEVMKARAEDAA